MVAVSKAHFNSFKLTIYKNFFIYAPKSPKGDLVCAT